MRRCGAKPSGFVAISLLNVTCSRVSTWKPAELFDERTRLRLRESADAMMRYVEELDAARERAAVISEELTAAAGERMNRTMYVLSLVSTVFLPLGFVTGLLGVNIAGIPGTESPVAFQLLAGGLVVLALVRNSTVSALAAAMTTRAFRDECGDSRRS